MLRFHSCPIYLEKVALINSRKSPIQDEYIEKYLVEKDLDLTATLDGAEAYRNADFVVIAAPTNYDPVKNFFDTHCIEDVIDLVLSVNPDAVMVIKSTIPVGYCRSLYVKYAAKGVKQFNLLFFPEFLRESKALYDNLYPSRIIAGMPKIIDRPEFAEENAAILAVTDIERLDKAAHTFAELLHRGAIKENIPTLYMVYLPSCTRAATIRGVRRADRCTLSCRASARSGRRLQSFLLSPVCSARSAS